MQHPRSKEADDRADAAFRRLVRGAGEAAEGATRPVGGAGGTEAEAVKRAGHLIEAAATDPLAAFILGGMEATERLRTVTSSGSSPAGGHDSNFDARARPEALTGPGAGSSAPHCGTQTEDRSEATRTDDPAAVAVKLGGVEGRVYCSGCDRSQALKPDGEPGGISLAEAMNIGWTIEGSLGTFCPMCNEAAARRVQRALAARGHL